MQIVRDLAGYSLGRADLVRRAMGKKKLDVMAKERENFVHGKLDENGNVEIPGCVRNGIDEESANKIFDEMAEFAKYAFNKSHAACYAVVAYRTAYLKAYYPAEFMAAMLNSFLGNLDKVPIYIDECRKKSIEILKPDINESFTKFTASGNSIRFGLGSIKNVGLQAVDNIVAEREKNGKYKDFTDFCERIFGESVNRKCIESLIKAGAFDNLGKTRATLIASYEGIIDMIADAKNQDYAGQVTMFDMGSEDNEMQKMKYNYTELPEYSEKELLSMEKEMLGIYISGHPLEKYKDLIAKISNVNILQLKEANETVSGDDEETLNSQSAENGQVISEKQNAVKDGQRVRLVAIIDKVKKKFTKNNKIMAFVTVEDMYGTCEVIVFESCYNNCSNILLEESVVVIDGRISMKEDADASIIANSIVDVEDEEGLKNMMSGGHYGNYSNNRNSSNYANTSNGASAYKNNYNGGVNDFSSISQAMESIPKRKKLTLEITNLDEINKEKLRGAIRFFMGDRNNTPVYVKQGEKLSSCGAIFADDEIIDEFAEIVGKENVVYE